MDPVREDLVAWRHVPHGGDLDSGEYWVFMDEDLTGASLHMQVRPAQGDTATALVNLSNAAAGAEGISLSYIAGYLDPDTGLPVGAWIALRHITQTTLEAIQAASDTAEPRVLEYDLHVTKAGGVKKLRAFGTFTLNPGVTI